MRDHYYHVPDITAFMGANALPGMSLNGRMSTYCGVRFEGVCADVGPQLPSIGRQTALLRDDTCCGRGCVPFFVSIAPHMSSTPHPKTDFDKNGRATRYSHGLGIKINRICQTTMPQGRFWVNAFTTGNPFGVQIYLNLV